MADIILKNDRLEVTVTEPGSLYRRQRFEWCGVATSVILDGKHSFLSKEPMFWGQITGGYGLSNNFEAANGFEYGNTPVGEAFPRVGIGSLIRNDRSPMSMYHDFDITPAPMSYTAEADKVTFVTEPLPVNGYAWRVVKEMKLDGNKLHTTHWLTNVGEKSVMLEESNHTYTMIDDYKIGPDYEMTVPYNVGVDVQRGKVAVEYNKITVLDYPEMFTFNVRGWEGCQPHSWTVTHKPTGIGYRETIKQPISKFFVWGCSTNFCPLVYVKVPSVPGETAVWTRTLEFFS